MSNRIYKLFLFSIPAGTVGFLATAAGLWFAALAKICRAPVDGLYFDVMGLMLAGFGGWVILSCVIVILSIALEDD